MSEPMDRLVSKLKIRLSLPDGAEIDARGARGTGALAHRAEGPALESA